MRVWSFQYLLFTVSTLMLPVFFDPVQGKPLNLYLTGAAGVNNPTQRNNTGVLGSFQEYTDPGVSAELGLGVDFGRFRVETTYAIDASKLRGYTNVRGVDFDYASGGEVRKQSVFLSGYWDVLAHSGSALSPYIGAGIGYSNLDVRDFSDPGLSYEGYNRSLLGYQFKAGLSMKTSLKSRIFAEGFYRGTSGYKTFDGFDTWETDSFGSWGGQFGVRFGI